MAMQWSGCSTLASWSHGKGQARNVRPQSIGPGPWRKSHWKPTAFEYLQGRHIILHSDCAKAYDMPFEDVVRDRVVHQPKK
eukprot:658525-Amphidinium_carterae.2